MRTSPNIWGHETFEDEKWEMNDYQQLQWACWVECWQHWHGTKIQNQEIRCDSERVKGERTSLTQLTVQFHPTIQSVSYSHPLSRLSQQSLDAQESDHWRINQRFISVVMCVTLLRHLMSPQSPHEKIPSTPSCCPQTTFLPFFNNAIQSRSVSCWNHDREKNIKTKHIQCQSCHRDTRNLIVGRSNEHSFPHLEDSECTITAAAQQWVLRMLRDQKVCDVIRVFFERENGLVLPQIPNLHIAIVISTEKGDSEKRKRRRRGFLPHEDVLFVCDAVDSGSVCVLNVKWNTLLLHINMCKTEIG